ncbi:mitochondrial import inner membrane translocase subunit Tim10 B isoform X1 [Numida meleagris]|uniref:mitochondrial import inner membrane translocase subunit Tim10 B isoform X1 n=1 Tax=Numida meleagris TaxID=8996 RepID=UPI000B3DCF7D|nr:mitochondrial import inner membrane translocase subunit Tim10 B isoform X1 [Numida meleagris]
MEPAAEQQQQLRSLRDFLLVYNRMTELCFRRCVSDLGYRLLSRRESWSLCKAPEEHEDFCTRGSETCHGRQLHTWGAVTACVRVQELSKENNHWLGLSTRLETPPGGRQAWHGPRPAPPCFCDRSAAHSLNPRNVSASELYKLVSMTLLQGSREVQQNHFPSSPLPINISCPHPVPVPMDPISPQRGGRRSVAVPGVEARGHSCPLKWG